MPISEDLVRSSLARPIDWLHFEKIVSELLADDDFPSLRSLGGVGDDGADAVEERFFEDGNRIDAIVQITSEKTQVSKYNRTVNRLRATGKVFSRLIVVFRQPVETSVRTAIQQKGVADGIAVDIRDEDYLVRRLARVDNGIYVRHFGDVREQVKQLLNQSDPLDTADDKLKRAVLASLGAYITHPASRLVRSTLFDRTVLAAMVAAGEGIDQDSLLDVVRELLPGEQIGKERLAAAIERLIKDKLVVSENKRIEVSEIALNAVTEAMNGINASIERLRQQVIAPVAKRHKLDEAAKGRLERNLKRAVTALFRRVGPTIAAAHDLAEVVSTDSVLHTISESLLPAVARSALAALSDYIADPDNEEVLAKLARSYAAVSLRNVDPLGRRFQQVALSRSTLILDTDAVLVLLIKELPEHRVLTESLNALQSEGVSIVVPEDMLTEAVGHVSRAQKTYMRCGSSLARLPEEVVDAEISHAVVRGYYYFTKTGERRDFFDYWAGYFDKERPLEFLRFILQRIVKCTFVDRFTVGDDERVEFDAMFGELLKHKEKKRKKAEFRNEDEMRRRLEIDLRCAVDVARRTAKAVDEAKGYIVSMDSAFSYMQTLSQWKKRPRVHIYTSVVPELAEYVCGVRLHDDEVVRLVFNPVCAAAAEQIADQVIELAKVGVNLRGESLFRLEWDVQHEFQNIILEHQAVMSNDASTNTDKLESSIGLAGKALAEGYHLDSEIDEVLNTYGGIKKELSGIKTERKNAVEVAKRLAAAGAGLSEKGKRRVKAVLRELGGEEFLNEASTPTDDSNGLP